MRITQILGSVISHFGIIESNSTVTFSRRYNFMKQCTRRTTKRARSRDAALTYESVRGITYAFPWQARVVLRPVSVGSLAERSLGT